MQLGLFYCWICSCPLQLNRLLLLRYQSVSFYFSVFVCLSHSISASLSVSISVGPLSRHFNGIKFARHNKNGKPIFDSLAHNKTEMKRDEMGKKNSLRLNPMLLCVFACIVLFLVVLFTFVFFYFLQTTNEFKAKKKNSERNLKCKCNEIEYGFRFVKYNANHLLGFCSYVARATVRIGIEIVRRWKKK